MTVVKQGKTITITLSDEESSAVDYFIHKKGSNILDEYFGFFFKSRVETRKVEEKEDLWRVVTDSEREELLKRQL